MEETSPEYAGLLGGDAIAAFLGGGLFVLLEIGFPVDGGVCGLELEGVSDLECVRNGTKRCLWA